jgi:phage gp46-like protein
MTADFVMSGSALVLGKDLETAVLISLFSEASADPGDIVPDSDPRGWWADSYATLEDPALTPLPDGIGSKIWQIFRMIRNQDTLNWLRDQCLKSLHWMIVDGVASSIAAEPVFTSNGGVGVTITITSNGRPTVFSYAWAQET